MPQRSYPPGFARDVLWGITLFFCPPWHFCPRAAVVLLVRDDGVRGAVPPFARGGNLFSKWEVLAVANCQHLGGLHTVQLRHGTLKFFDKLLLLEAQDDRRCSRHFGPSVLR